MEVPQEIASGLRGPRRNRRVLAESGQDPARERRHDTPGKHRRQPHQVQRGSRADRGPNGIGVDRGPGRRLLHIGIGARPDRAGVRGGVPELQRFVMRPQLRDAPVDLGCQRVVARARLSPARYAAAKGLCGKPNEAG
jgi:hypothetical protein